MEPGAAQSTTSLGEVLRRGRLDPLAIGLVTGFVVVGYWAIFRLPFRFPLTTKIVSPSLVFGFNNSVAIASVVVLLGAATLGCLWGRRRSRVGTVGRVAFPLAGEALAPRIRWRFLTLMVTAHALLTLLMYVKARRSSFWVIDFEASHFLWRLELIESYGLRPYVDFQHEYGPALLYPGILFYRALAPLGASMEASYYASYLALNVLGLWAMFAVLNAAAMPRGRKEVAFCLIGAAGLTPYMGLNGSLVRYMTPYLSVLVAHRALDHAYPRARAFVIVLALSIVNILISPEIGLAFAIAWGFYCVVTALRERREAALGLSALVLAVVGGVGLLPSEYSSSLFRFSAGANNFPLLPAPHIVFYLAVLFLAVPPLLADALAWPGRRGALLMSLATLCVVMIPGALGRADPPHVLFYSLGVSMILLIQLANRSRRAFAIYAVLYAIVVIGGLHLSNARSFYGIGLRSLHPRNLLAFLRSAEPELSSSHFDRLDKYPRFGLPFCSYGADRQTMAYLWSRRRIEPEYYCGVIGVYTEAELSRKLADLRRHEYILLLKGWERPWQPDVCGRHLRIVRNSFIYPARLPCVREALESDLAINATIVREYRTVETVGPYVVMKRVASGW